MDLAQAFNKIRQNLDKKSGFKNQIIKIIFDLTKIELSPNTIETKKENIYLKVSSIQRSQIILKKKEILEKIKKDLELDFLNII